VLQLQPFHTTSNKTASARDKRMTDANVVRIAVRANSFVISVGMSVRCCCADYHTYILLAQKSRALCFFQSIQMIQIFCKKKIITKTNRHLCGGEWGRGYIYPTLAAILEGIHISLVICVRGYTYHCDTGFMSSRLRIDPCTVANRRETNSTRGNNRTIDHLIGLT